MMILEKDSDSLKIKLSDDCKIFNIEEDYQQLIKHLDGVQNLILEISNDTELDTAYFQMLLSLKNSGFNVVKIIPNENLKLISLLYGVNI